MIKFIHSIRCGPAAWLQTSWRMFNEPIRQIYFELFFFHWNSRSQNKFLKRRKIWEIFVKFLSINLFISSGFEDWFVTTWKIVVPHRSRFKLRTFKHDQYSETPKPNITSFDIYYQHRLGVLFLLYLNVNFQTVQNERFEIFHSHIDLKWEWSLCAVVWPVWRHASAWMWVRLPHKST